MSSVLPPVRARRLFLYLRESGSNKKGVTSSATPYHK
jgi:hypothetical protein